MTHTLGPWMIDESHGITIVSNDWVIGRVTYGCTAKQKGTAFANARLIAAAPEMLAALELAQKLIGHSEDMGSQFIANVIAKAKGESK